MKYSILRVEGYLVTVMHQKFLLKEMLVDIEVVHTNSLSKRIQVGTHTLLLLYFASNL